MILIALSAAFVGFVHSLAPGHWLPVVLTVKLRRWNLRQSALGAVAAAAGHILISSALGIVTMVIGAEVLTGSEAVIERSSGALLLLFGVGYAAYAYFRHAACHGHEHHGPNPRGQKAPYVFLFSMGFSPCVAVLPIFAAAAAHGPFSIALSVLAFSAGVLGSFLGATILVSRGIVKLDHPFLEHYGDVLTGLGVALLGAILFWIG